ncbi:fungal-specific transcription factor domain-containing protein [Sparassis latifolia]
MAHQALDEPAQSSPEFYSDEPSSNASPVSASPSLNMTPAMFDEGDSSGRGSATSTPARSAPETTRPHSAGKGGCWTCRVRRKKCDEEREGESCKTCLRLGLKCLGWGVKRPDWMRDKERVAAYRAEIKEQLTREGRIRGQPRTTFGHLHPPPPPPPPLGVAGPGPSTLRRNHSFGEGDASFRRAYAASPYHHPHRLVHGRGTVSARSSPTAQHYPLGVPFVAPMDAPFDVQEFPYHPASLSPTLPIPTNEPVPEPVPYTPFLPAAHETDAPHSAGLALPSPHVAPGPFTTVDEYLGYYFNYVQKVQYAFAGPALTNTLYPIVAADPSGVVAHAICALSSLHSTRVRIAQRLEAPVQNPEQSMPKYFYDQALAQIARAKAHGAQYADADAVAAVQLISFSVLANGWGDWPALLEVACDWLGQSRIHEEQNPKLTLLNMSPAARYAAKATMWIDVFSSITFMQPPRFLPLYRRLFAGGGGFWANSQQQHFDLRMDALTGCPDEAVLAIAEISALAHWKAAEQRSGSLSMRELVRRGDLIEQQLRQLAVPRQYADVEEAAAAADAQQPGLEQADAAASAVGSYAMEEVRQLTADIFRETAVLYLHTVLSESIRGVPEIVQSVSTIVALLNQLPPSDYDRALIFPLFLTGSMTEDPLLQNVIKERFALVDDGLGHIMQARTLLEHIWSRSAPIHGSSLVTVVEWRETLCNQWRNLLLL